MVTRIYSRKTFKHRVFYFVRNVIRHRVLLMNAQKSHTNKALNEKYIGILVANNSIDKTDKGAGVFFITHAEEILFLIKPNDREKMKQFRELLEKSKAISKL